MPVTSLAGKRVLLRADFNVPIKNGEVQDDTRIRKTIPTIKHIVEAGGSVCLCSHLGRPDGKPNQKYTLTPVAERLAKLTNAKVDFVTNFFDDKWKGGSRIVLLENTRFVSEEEENDTLFAEALAKDCDLFVNDAFGAAHRGHASTEAVAGILPHAAGFLLEKEVVTLKKIMDQPEHPVVLIVGGAKMKTKIGVLEKFTEIADTILVAGGIANTMLAAKGFEIGGSLAEEDKQQTARDIVNTAQKKYCNLIIPEDVVVSTELENKDGVRSTSISDIRKEEKVFDIGPKTIKKYADKITSAKTVIWNGPVGLFEETPFDEGTKAILQAVKDCEGSTILGGGDTLDAISRFGFSVKDFTHVSTGGGAMLELLEGKELPAVVALD